MTEEEYKSPDEIRHYTATSSAFKLDWNMLLYSAPADDGFVLDWNKLIYNEEQLAQFNAEKLEKRVRADFIEYLIKPVAERTPMELYYLKEGGFTVEEDETDIEYDKMTATSVVRDC
jgi:hypothetical protein